ncbi:MAG: sugar nucleotide-binding protein [Chitinophagaceae bacterium]|nr:sugar nucleotide-binding protein [Chitinophagaceae bacterium]
MKALVTGAGGTIGKVLCGLLEQRRIEVISWNRNKIPLEDYQQMEDFVSHVQPDILFHLGYASKPSGIENESWKINYEWPGELAWITRKLNVKFLFTSTNLVFSNSQQGPFDTASIPQAESGYGYEKRKAEEYVLSQNPASIVARLGWQIASAAGSNNMIDYLQNQMNKFGEVRVNINWKPACSFIEDTCDRLLDLALNDAPSLYMIDANTRWNLFEIATALNHQHGNRWKILPFAGENIDNRMNDERINIPALDQRLNLH